MKKFFSFLILVGSFQFGYAQTVLDNNPPHVKWYQVKTPHFNVLFPEGFDEQAKRMANRLEYIYLPETNSLTTQPRPISIVMQNRSAESNAFVTITPRRAEFYTMPSQDYNFIGNVDWLDLTAVHEFRHVVQFDHSKQGFNKFIYYLTGNYGLSTMANLAVPSWFWEGDAVTEETAITNTGRGRIPNFGLVFRTNLLEGRTFNYHKQLLRSYKDNIPNQYVLGYHMVSYLRKRTGDPEIWSKITGRAWSSSIVPFTFSNAIKKETGLHVTTLYQEMAKDLQQSWKQHTDSIELTPFTQLNKRDNNSYTDYQYPQVTDDGVMAMKSGIGDIDQLVLLKGGEERKVFVQGIVNPTGMISAVGSRVVWNEYRYDPRWRVQNYSTIVAYDFVKKKKWIVGSKWSRYAGAALSPDGIQVVTTQTDRKYQHAVLILNAENGVLVKKFENPENYFYSMPRWSDDGTAIVLLKNTPNGKAVSLIDVNSGNVKDILPPSDENVGYPVLYKNYLLYNSPQSGIDNIYAYELKSGKKFQVTNSRYGAYNPTISKDGSVLIYNEQGRNGIDVVAVKYDPSSWKVITMPVDEPIKPLYEYVVEQERLDTLMGSIPKNDYPVTRYSKLKGLINPYTWGPFFNSDFSSAIIGVASRDVLSTTSINAGYQYDIYEETGAWHGGISYQGWYPILNLDVSYGTRKENKSLTTSREVDFEWTEKTVSAGVLIPLVLTKSKYLTSLNISNNVGYTLTSSFSSTVTNPANGDLVSEGSNRFISINSADTLFYAYRNITDHGQLIYNHFSASYGHTLKQSRRDFNPKFGQFLLFDHLSTPFGGDYQGWQWAARGYFYFPGILKHHSIELRGGYQESQDGFDLDLYEFRNYLFKPRGYSYPLNSKFTSLSANYAFPIWYPDISLGPIVNIQRIKANLFYDYGRGEGFNYFYNFEEQYYIPVPNGATYNSYGGELTVDVNIFRLLPQFEIGFRAVNLKENTSSSGGWIYEFLIGNIAF